VHDQRDAERNDVPMQEGCSTTRQRRSGNTMTMAFASSNPPASGEIRPIALPKK
jgi:hypothetical protein